MRILQHICFLIVASGVVSVCLLSCSNKQEQNSGLGTNQRTKISNSNTNQFDIAEFERNRELWTSQNIQNYKMIIGAQGFMMNFPEQVLIEVQRGKAKSIKSLSNTGKNYVEAYENYDTVEKIFNFVENSKKANKLNVRFNETLGYPTQIIFDERFDMSDDELTLAVESLEITK